MGNAFRGEENGSSDNDPDLPALVIQVSHQKAYAPLLLSGKSSPCNISSEEPDVNCFSCAGSLKSLLECILTYELCSNPEFHKDITTTMAFLILPPWYVPMSYWIEKWRQCLWRKLSWCLIGLPKEQLFFLSDLVRIRSCFAILYVAISQETYHFVLFYREFMILP